MPGAEMALSFMMSSHPAEMATRRAGTKAELAAFAEPRAARASDLASYAAWDMYVSERAAGGTPLLEGDYALPLGDPKGSTDKTGGKENGSSAGVYADTEEAGIGVTIGAHGASTS
ncbi:hypothetical protein D1007_55113 [Hordeum vulgare]|nr:hypothetical protein D1007_55113 [Hordeum vulgare]